MSDEELPLPEFAEMPRVQVIRPRYRIQVEIEVTYDDYYEFETDEDPDGYLDQNEQDVFNDIVHWGNGPEDWYVKNSREIEITYDNGAHWEKYIPPEEPNAW